MGIRRDILIRVYGRTDPSASYPVDAELDDGGYYFGGELRIQDRDLLKLELDIPKYGSTLGQSLFSPPVQRAIERAYASAAADPGAQIRIRLCFYPDARELHAYPWERLVALWQGEALKLAASPRTPFSRYIQLNEGDQKPVEERPIRLLFVVSNPIHESMPRGLAEIAVEDELRSLVEAVKGVSDLAIRVLPGRTGISDGFAKDLAARGIAVVPGNTTLNSVAAEAGRADVLHILSHGLYDAGTASLCLEGPDGKLLEAKDTEIQGLIAGLKPPPRLVYLSACQSAEQDPDDLNATVLKPRQPHPMVGLAPKLVEAGVPAVIAMQDLVQVDLAHSLAAEFYTRLLDGGEVDVALNGARLAVIQPASKEWAIPALFLRLRDGRLFATDPAREALDSTLRRLPKRPEWYYLPLEGVLLTTPDLIADWERASVQRQMATGLWDAFRPFADGLTVLIGDSGSGKSTLLERVARATAAEASGGTATNTPGNTPANPGSRTVPLLVDLRNYTNVRAFVDNRIERLLYEAFLELSPGLSEERFARLLSGGAARFRLLFDHGDELPERVQRAVLQDINQLVADYGGHQYIVALDCRGFRPWAQIRQLFVIQPLSVRKITSFLSPDDGQAADAPRARLLDRIRESELFEFAAVPWLLLHMLEQVKQNVLPRSRIMVLRDWVQTAMYSVAEDGGRSDRASESLCALAWNMQATRRSSLGLEEAFAVLAEVRGQRDYKLEELLDRLVRSGILVRSGDESIRFAYSALQAFGAATQLLNDPEQGTQIEELVATLGQPSRVKLWTPTLALLAGMMDNAVPLIGRLVYATSLTRGEQVFVAALCLLEHSRRPGAEKEAPGDEIASLRQQVCAALLWRAKRANEPEVAYRQRAVEFLGLLRRTEALPLLVSLAVERVRVVAGQPPDFEYSQVRFAAIEALRLMRGSLGEDVIGKYPEAKMLIGGWEQGDVAELSQLLSSSEPGIQGVAAFALGDLQKPAAAAELCAAFRDAKTDPATLWAITDSLQAVDPGVVMEGVVNPLVAEARRQPRPPQEDRFERLIYLIGQLRTRDEDAIAFVHWYLEYPCSKVFKGRALVALGRLRWSEKPEEQGWWSAVVQGDLEAIAAGDEPDRVFLQRKAIQAIGELGDLQLLYKARQTPNWVPELDEAFFRAAEACMAFPSAQPISETAQGGQSNGAKRLHAGGL